MESKIPQRSFFYGDRVFAYFTRVLGGLLIVLLIGILISLVTLSWAALKTFGWHFLITDVWEPNTNQFGAVAAILGTLAASLIAMVIAIPLSFGIAVLISEILPKPIGRVMARAIELMAGIPSIIYGMWGLFILVPFMATHVQPWLINTFDDIPVLNIIFGGVPIGIGVFTAGLVLAIMVLPLISSVMRDVLETVLPVMREAAYGVGATRREVVMKILVPYTRAGLLGGVILGFGRALGETMAVTFVIGNSHHLFNALFMPGTTISATIANEFTEAYGKLYPASLMELGLILFVMTFIVLAISRIMLSMLKTRGGSQ